MTPGGASFGVVVMLMKLSASWTTDKVHFRAEIAIRLIPSSGLYRACGLKSQMAVMPRARAVAFSCLGKSSAAQGLPRDDLSPDIQAWLGAAS